MVQTLRNRVHFLSVLRHRDYRRYYLGHLASVSAHQGMIAAQGWLVYDMTGLAAALGFVAAAQAVPGIVLNLVAGAMADRWDPRRMIIIGEGGAAVLMGALALLVLTGVVELWHIVAISFLVGIFISYDQPARRAIWPVLVPREDMLYATSLNQTVWNGTRITAPPIATGVIAIVATITGDAHLGAAVSFLVIAVGFFAMVAAMLMIRFPDVERSKGATVFHDIVDGLVFTYKNRIFFILLMMGFMIGYFGLSYMWLLPAYAVDYLGDEHGVALGWLMAFNGAGGLVGVLGVASFGAYQNRTWLLIGGGIASGVAVVLFGLTAPLGLFILAAFLGAAAGALHSLFQVASTTVVNLLVPNEFRGRVLGVRGIMWSLAPLGALHAGLLATWTSIPFAIAFGGAIVILCCILAFAWSKDVRNLRQLVEQADTGGVWARPDNRSGGRPSTWQRPG